MIIVMTFQVFSTSMGLTKTVYNPAAMKAAQKSSEEALKKKQVREETGNTEKGGVDKNAASNQLGLSYKRR